MRMWAALNKNFPLFAQKIPATDKNYLIRKAIAKRDDINIDIAKIQVKDENIEGRKHLAENKIYQLRQSSG